MSKELKVSFVRAAMVQPWTRGKLGRLFAQVVWPVYPSLNIIPGERGYMDMMARDLALYPSKRRIVVLSDDVRNLSTASFIRRYCGSASIEVADPSKGREVLGESSGEHVIFVGRSKALKLLSQFLGLELAMPLTASESTYTVEP